MKCSLQWRQETSAERERKRLDAGFEELDLELPIDNRPQLEAKEMTYEDIVRLVADLGLAKPEYQVQNKYRANLRSATSVVREPKLRRAANSC
jgi:hypothetical protein